ncbi:translation initiation factor eIF3 subunit g [Chytriomyces hyalinus]|nr:translation initiation factor eIF3 subunit g [Chytriomyces hyalinus]KAJ3264259.1 translation initiation factor eIF3 subunit g [Chytriomyces hyalinus]
MSTKQQWGDDVEEDDVYPKTIQNADGTKTVIKIIINDDGKKVKVTTKIRTKTVKSQVNPAIARRRNLRKFGDCSGLKMGPDTDSTSFGEIVSLKMSASSKVLDSDVPSAEEAKKKAALANSKIMCRICKGDHFTAKCPFKDSHQPLLAGGAGESSFREETPAAITSSAAAAGGPAKYVPPGMRGNAAGGAREGNRMPGGRDGDRDDLPTVRISNLSEDTTEQDVRDLIVRFGHTSRVFVARDRDTNTCKGFGYVTFYDKFDAERCITALNGYGYDNLILSAEFAKTKQRA